MNPLAVTTSGKLDEGLLARAREIAARWQLPLVERGRKQPLEHLWAEADALLIVGRDGVTLRDREGPLRWTPGMATLRIGRLDAGQTDDTLVRLGEFREGDAVLDCTLGLAQDALVAARAVGPKGRVVGLEKSLALCAVVAEGLRAFDPGPRSCRVEPWQADALAHLRAQADGSFAVVLFDPMFERTRPASGSFQVLRRFADYSPLTREAVEEARRVARRWVLVKASRYSKDLSKLGLTPEPASRFATVLWARVPGLGRGG